MFKRLTELGIPAVITRDTDRTLTREERINTAVNSFGRNSDVILVSNHINAGGVKDSCGKLTFFEKYV